MWCLYLQHSEEDDACEEEKEEQQQEVDAGLTVPLPALETEELDQTVDVRQEEFEEFDPGNNTIEEELKDKKVERNVLPLFLLLSLFS